MISQTASTTNTMISIAPSTVPVPALTSTPRKLRPGDHERRDDHEDHPGRGERPVELGLRDRRRPGSRTAPSWSARSASRSASSPSRPGTRSTGECRRPGRCRCCPPTAGAWPAARSSWPRAGSRRARAARPAAAPRPRRWPRARSTAPPRPPAPSTSPPGTGPRAGRWPPAPGPSASEGWLSAMPSPSVPSGIPAITVINRDLGNCKSSACRQMPQGPVLKRLVQLADTVRLGPTESARVSNGRVRLGRH